MHILQLQILKKLEESCANVTECDFVKNTTKPKNKKIDLYVFFQKSNSKQLSNYKTIKL